MNALAISPTGLGSIALAGFNPAVALANSSVAAKANGFTNLISALFGAAVEQDSAPASLAKLPALLKGDSAWKGAPAAPEKKIADAMIRSMLGAHRESSKAKPPAASSTHTPAQTQNLAAIEVKVATAVPLTEDQMAEEPALVAETKPSDPVAQEPSIEPQVPVAFTALLVPLQPAATAAEAATSPTEAKTESSLKIAPVSEPKTMAREEEPVRVLAVAQSASATESFARAFEDAAAPAAPQIQPADVKPATTFGTVAQTLRASEIAAAPAATPVNTAPVHDIAVRISRPDLPAVDLHFAERAGEIHVAVRTPDAPLATSLRQDLPALTSSLERAGYRAETFVPHQSAGTPQISQFAKSNAHDDRQQQSSQRDSNGQDSQSASQGRQQRHRERNLQQWLNEMEKQS